MTDETAPPDEAQNDAQNDAEESTISRWSWWTRMTAILTPIAALFIALGEASDATFLLRDMSNEVVSAIGHSREYETLSSIHAGNTVAHVESLLGSPEVTKNLGDGLTANYFATDKFLITIFYSGERVEGFVVVPTIDDLQPDVELGGGSSQPLGTFEFAAGSQSAKDHYVDFSRSTGFYVESLESRPAGRFVDIYLGSVSYGTGGVASDVRELYQAELGGDPNEIARARSALRGSAIPNLYGEGEVPLAQVRDSLMTRAEFASYFDPN